MKKYLVCFCAAALVLGMTACGTQKNPGGSQQSTGASAPQGETSAAPDKSTPAQESTPAESSSGAQTQEPEGGWSKEMQAVRDAVAAELGENYFPDMQVPKEQMEPMIGISSDLYEDYLLEVPMISVNVDTLLVIKAKEGKTAEVEKVVKAYQENLINNAMQYPMNMGKVQASSVATVGSYVCFVQLGGDTDAAFEKGEDEAVIKHCQQQNELALGIIKQNLPQ